MSDDLEIKIQTLVEGRNDLEKAIADLRKLIGTVSKGDTEMKGFSKQLDDVAKSLRDVEKASQQTKTPEYLTWDRKYASVGKEILSVQNKMRDLMAEIDLLANKDDPLKRAFDPSKQKDLDDARAKMRELSGILDGLNKKQEAVRQQMSDMREAGTKYNFINYDKLIADTDKLKDKVTSVSDSVRKVQQDRADAERKAAEEAELAAKIQSSAYAGTANEITSIIQKVGALSTELDSAKSAVNNASYALRDGMKVPGKDLEAYVRTYDVAAKSAKEVTNRTSELIKEIVSLKGKVPDDIYEYLRDGIFKAEQEVGVFNSRLSETQVKAQTTFGPLVDKFSQIKDLQKQISEINIAKALAFNDTTTVNTYNSLVSSLNSLVEEFTETVNISDMQLNANKQLTISWLQIDKLIAQIGKELAYLKEHGDSPIEAERYKELQATLIQLKAASARYAKEVKGTVSAHKSGSKSTAQYKSSMKDLSTAVKDAKQNFEKMNKAVSKITGSIGSKLKGGLKTIMKYVLGFRSLFFLVRKVRGMIKEGLDNLVQFQSATNETNHQMTELQSSLLFLKNAFGAMIAPVLNVVLPVLNTLIDALANVGNAIARFFAQLTGQATVIQAVKVGVQDYADSLKDAGKSAGSAAKKAKDLHDRLAPFDDLQVLGVDKDKNKDGSGGGGGAGDDLMPSIDEMFKRINTGRGLGDMLKDALERGNLFGVGQYIGELIKKGIDNIDWEAIKEKLSSGITLVTSFLNGLLTTKGLFSSIGTGLAEGFNTLIGGIKQFFDEIQWSEIYAGIGEGLTSFFSTLDYEQILQTAVSIAQSFVDAITGFFSTFDLAPAINKLFGDLKKTLGSKKLKKLLSGLADLPIMLFNWLNNGIANIDWTTLGEALADGLTLAMGIATERNRGNELSSKISTFITNVLFAGLKLNIGLVTGLINNLSDKVAELLMNAFGDKEKSVSAKIATVLTAILFGPLKLILSALTSVLSGIGEAIAKNLGLDFSAEDFKEIGSNIINGVYQGITDTLTDVGDWLKTNVVDPIVLGFKTVFGIASPSKVMEEYGGYVMEGVLEGMKGVVEDVIEVFKDIKDKAIEKMQAFKLKATLVWQLIKTTFVTMATKIKDAVATPFTDMKDNLITTVTTMKNKIVTLWRLMWGGIKGIINNILEGVESFCNNIIDGINDVIDALDFTDKIPDAVKEKLNIEDVSITKLEHISIPRLATGAVIPPNREFLAMLGDQKSGTNIEAPLDTIVDAFREVVGNLQVENTGSAVMQVDGQTFARLMTPYVVSELGRRGYDVKIIGG